MMKGFKVLGGLLLFLLITLIAGCAQHGQQNQVAVDPQDQSSQATKQQKPFNPLAQNTVGATRPVVQQRRNTTPIKWKPSYTLTDVDISSSKLEKPLMLVGANIMTKDVKVPLHTVIKTLADLKGMNVSWSSDVDQDALVSVNIKANSNFWDSLDEILRQVDYFYEFKNNTIIVKYKDTQRFYIASPFLTGRYRTAVGGDFLGTAGELNTGLQGTLSVTHEDDNIDLWANIEENLKRILNLGTLSVPEKNDLAKLEAQARAQCYNLFPSDTDKEARQRCIEKRLNAIAGKSDRNGQNQNNNAGSQALQNVASALSGNKNNNNNQTSANGERQGFFYTIDKPLGIITVTAPRSLLKQVKAYIDNLKKVLSRQVIIEAKILEVRLDDSDTRGIDWSGLLKDSRFTFLMTFGNQGKIYPTQGVKFLESVTMTKDAFDLVVNFLKEFGKVNVLSNPKISLLNGQPAMITGGRTTRYVDKVTTVVNSSTGGVATTSYTVETKDILSGIGLGVIANIASEDEIILQLTPVNSRLLNPDNMKSVEFGSFLHGYARVDLPEVNLREMTTMAKVKNGQLLIIGGIIDEESGVEGNKVPILGDIPLIGYAFKSERKYVRKRELVILLRPQIVEL